MQPENKKKISHGRIIICALRQEIMDKVCLCWCTLLSLLPVGFQEHQSKQLLKWEWSSGMCCCTVGWIITNVWRDWDSKIFWCFGNHWPNHTVLCFRRLQSLYVLAMRTEISRPWTYRPCISVVRTCDSAVWESNFLSIDTVVLELKSGHLPCTGGLVSRWRIKLLSLYNCRMLWNAVEVGCLHFYLFWFVTRGILTLMSEHRRIIADSWIRSVICSGNFWSLHFSLSFCVVVLNCIECTILCPASVNFLEGDEPVEMKYISLHISRTWLVCSILYWE
jgi:hypothetical protein